MIRSIAWFLVATAVLASAARAEDIQVPSVLIKLHEQVDVPARVAGPLTAIVAREGEIVEAGAPLAQIEDGDAKIEKRRADLELVAARRAADSDVQVRYAKKSLEVAQTELRRAVDSEKRLAQSVSKSELDQLRLLVQRGELEVEEAQLEWELAQTTRESKENDVRLADYAIRQRQVAAPLAGFVAEVHRHRGEWVQPGQPILRMVRLDRLRAEGLVNARSVQGDVNGRPVKLIVQLNDQKTATYAGKLAFVSPEIDPVNGQVRIWAEIENEDLKLRPGLHGSLVIEDAKPGDQDR
jgi:RND family efflux transporter MFP subunit